MALAACTRAHDVAADAGGARAAAPAEDAALGASALDAGKPAPPAAKPADDGRPRADTSSDVDGATFAEARRMRIARPVSDPVLASYAAPLRTHFGAAFASPLRVQIASVGEARSALLVTHDGADPFVILADAEHRVLWQKDRPAGGIVVPVGDLAIASGPSGRVVLAACDPPTSTVALRQWNDDATPFADFHAFDADGCEAISLLRWPRHGWVIVAWRSGVARAELLSERGMRAWGDGVDLGVPTRSGAPGAIALDTPDTMVLVERAPLPGGQTAYAVEHVLAQRYDASGNALWRAPVDLGPAPSDDAGAHRPRPVIDRAAGRDEELTIELQGHKVGLTSRGETRGSF